VRTNGICAFFVKKTKEPPLKWIPHCGDREEKAALFSPGAEKAWAGGRKSSTGKALPSAATRKKLRRGPGNLHLVFQKGTFFGLSHGSGGPPFWERSGSPHIPSNEGKIREPKTKLPRAKWFEFTRKVFSRSVPKVHLLLAAFALPISGGASCRAAVNRTRQ